MKVLRKQTEPMLRHLFYPFLRAVIARWPLDSSQSLLIELWLSYIQPWRYQYPQLRGRFPESEQQLSLDIARYSNFIQDNLLVYTQVFVELLPRLERIDYSCAENAFLLLRLIKVHHCIVITFQDTIDIFYNPIIVDLKSTDFIILFGKC